MNRVIIPTSDPAYGDVYFSKDQIISIIRENNSIKFLPLEGTDQTTFTLAVSEVGSSATYDAFIEAIYAANPGGDTRVMLPEGQSITAVTT
jgi:hypothetical protein